jgi:tRNA A-37 threonylcarbamoyl transferase component Bud32
VDKFADVGEELLNHSPQPEAGAPQLFKANAISQLQPGQIIDRRFKIISVIAAGGFGCVYKVQHILMKKVFALKMLHPVTASESTMLRMRREAEAVSKLDHPNIVSANDFGMTEDGSQPFLVMEFVEGPTLSELLKQRTRLPWEEALQIFIPLCYAMAYAHDQGIIHRDIKPGNIILARDENNTTTPKVVDFGIAKLQSGGDELSLTQTGDVFGTPLYMSPEQCAGTSVDSRSDIYALGCVMFETLTGAPPFRGNNALETMMKHSTATALSLKEASLGIRFPNQLEQLIAKMLAKESHDRYQNFMDVGNDLILLQKGDVNRMRVIAVPARATPEVAKATDWDWRSSILAFLVGIVLSAAIVSFIYDRYVMPQIIAQSTQKGQKDEKAEVSVWYKPMARLDEDYFRTEPYAGIFNFPKRDLGTLNWQTGKAHGSVKVSGTQTVPQGAQLYFDAGPAMISTPYWWGFFRKDDLAGIRIKSRMDSLYGFLGDTDFAILAATQQQDLQVLMLNGIELSERGFRSIGEVNGLRYLSIKQVKFRGKKEDSRNLRGSELAALPNMSKIDTLTLEDIDDVVPLLTCLKAGHVRKLQLRSCRVTLKDLALIKQIRSLEVLDLCDVADALLSQELSILSEMPNLRQLRLPMQLDIDQPGAPLKSFPKLQQLVIAYIDEGGQRELAEKSHALRDRLRVPPTFHKQIDFQVEPSCVDGKKIWFLPWASSNPDF